MSSIKLHWLENRSKGGYVTFGVPWKKGEVTKETVFSVNDENGNAIAYQEKADCILSRRLNKMDFVHNQNRQ